MNPHRHHDVRCLVQNCKWNPLPGHVYCTVHEPNLQNPGKAAARVLGRMENFVREQPIQSPKLAAHSQIPSQSSASERGDGGIFMRNSTETTKNSKKQLPDKHTARKSLFKSSEKVSPQKPPIDSRSPPRPFKRPRLSETWTTPNGPDVKPRPVVASDDFALRPKKREALHSSLGHEKRDQGRPRQGRNGLNLPRNTYPKASSSTSSLDSASKAVFIDLTKDDDDPALAVPQSRVQTSPSIRQRHQIYPNHTNQIHQINTNGHANGFILPDGQKNHAESDSTHDRRVPKESEAREPSSKKHGQQHQRENASRATSSAVSGDQAFHASANRAPAELPDNAHQKQPDAFINQSSNNSDSTCGDIHLPNTTQPRQEQMKQHPRTEAPRAPSLSNSTNYEELQSVPRPNTAKWPSPKPTEFCKQNQPPIGVSQLTPAPTPLLNSPRINGVTVPSQNPTGSMQTPPHLSMASTSEPQEKAQVSISNFSTPPRIRKTHQRSSRATLSPHSATRSPATPPTTMMAKEVELRTNRKAEGVQQTMGTSQLQPVSTSAKLQTNGTRKPWRQMSPEERRQYWISIHDAEKFDSHIYSENNRPFTPGDPLFGVPPEQIPNRRRRLPTHWGYIDPRIHHSRPPPPQTQPIVPAVGRRKERIRRSIARAARTRPKTSAEISKMMMALRPGFDERVLPQEIRDNPQWVKGLRFWIDMEEAARARRRQTEASADKGKTPAPAPTPAAAMSPTDDDPMDLDHNDNKDGHVPVGSA
ncbi:hypothetical protein F5Y16DRAFT_118917 [Xylariaceae sp. FL0255]|nr:hypothetical protein F5Y16DRAFT_118917 [Xylariaceae sp. FL0255]